MLAVRRGLLPLAALALLALHAFARLRVPPLVTTRDILPCMNFATVRMRGRVQRVAREPRFGQKPYLSVQLTDAAGALRIVFDPAAAAEMIRLNAVPHAGVSLDVAGTLQYRCGQRPLLRVHSAQQVLSVKERPRRNEGTPGASHA